MFDLSPEILQFGDLDKGFQMGGEYQPLRRWKIGLLPLEGRLERIGDRGNNSVPPLKRCYSLMTYEKYHR